MTRVVRHIGYKGFAFIILGILFILIGAANIGGPKPPPSALENMTILLRIAPLEFWYLSWVGAGLAAIVAAFVRRLEPYAAGATASLPVVFSITYFFTAALGIGYRAWAAGILYLLIAGLVAIITIWPDPLRHTPK